MAAFKEWDQASLRAWKAWLAERPQVIRDMAASHPPNRLYRHAPTGQRVTIMAYSEDGTCRMAVTGEYNFLAMEHGVLYGKEVFAVTRAIPQIFIIPFP